MLLFVYLSVLWLPLWLARAQSQPSPPCPPPASQAPDTSSSQKVEAASPSEPALLPEGTPVKLKLLHTLNSKVITPGDPLNFSVAENVVIEGKAVVPAGAAAFGHVQVAKPARTLGRGAQLALQFEYLKAGGTHVPLRGTRTRLGENKKGDTAALVVLFGLSGLVKHGSEIEIKEGSILCAFVAADTKMSPPSLAP